MCRNKTHALLVSAFHCFGWNYGDETLADGKGGNLCRGKQIPIQIAAAGWRKGKFRGKAPAVPGRPPKGLITTSTKPSQYFTLTLRPQKWKWPRLEGALCISDSTYIAYSRVQFTPCLCAYTTTLNWEVFCYLEK